jgi:hypothetical protein
MTNKDLTRENLINELKSADFQKYINNKKLLLDNKSVYQELQDLYSNLINKNNK